MSLIHNLNYLSNGRYDKRSERDLGKLMITAVMGVIALAGVAIKGAHADKAGKREKLFASNVEQCVADALPGMKHRIDGDSVLLLTASDKPQGTFGLTPDAGDHGIAKPLHLTSAKVRKCKTANALS